jgi:signal transduction histidine kinase
MAGIAAIFTIRALRAFEFNRQQALATARQRVEEEIAQRDALRQEFLQRIVEAQEEERARIARELHDEFGQVLTGLAVGLRGVQTSVDNSDLLRQQLSQLEEMAVQALGGMRHLINELRPTLLDDLGLTAALRQHVDNFATLTDMETSLALCDTCDNLHDSIKTTLFRVTQESLTNIARHAQATHAWIELSCDDDWVTLQVKDDGIGFDPAGVFERNTHTGWGLMGIQERVNLVDGEMQIQSETGKGTTLTIKVSKKMGEIHHVTHQTTIG